MSTLIRRWNANTLENTYSWVYKLSPVARLSILARGRKRAGFAFSDFHIYCL